VSGFRSPYPHYDVLSKWDSPSWNGQTREVIRERLHEIPPRRFFSQEQWSLLQAIADRIIPQPERSEPVPIVPWIDKMLFDNRGPGYRWADLPPIRDSWTHGLQAIDAEAQHRHGKSFEDLSADEQDDLLADIQHARVNHRFWGELPPDGFFERWLLKTIVSIYYAHPLAWDEIGFGGPASPRGYVRLGIDERDPWEAVEEHPLAD
jgi:hypothetical protein